MLKIPSNERVVRAFLASPPTTAYSALIFNKMVVRFSGITGAAKPTIGRYEGVFD
jgi:hypothetical protein